MMEAIRVQALSHRYNHTQAVSDLSFDVKAGEIFGFLGPNGAGKTTTIRVLTGQLVPTSGQVTVLGHDVIREPQSVKAVIGVVFEYQNLYERLSAQDNLAFAARLYGVPAKRIDQVLEIVKLTDRRRERVKRFSNGMKQRVLIARALLHEPQILFLDEPTRGLDPGVARDIRNLVARLARDGVTIFLTTHYMEEADQLCDRVAILDHGQLVALDAPARLKTEHAPRQVNLALQDGANLTLALDDPADASQLADLSASGRVRTMHTSESTLEDVFINLTGRSLGHEDN